MSPHENEACQGCAEYRELSRRGFLAIAGGGAAMLAAAPAWLPRVAMAKDYRSGQKDVIVSIYLRGAADGLSLVPPYGDAGYYANRPNIAVPPPDSGQALKAYDLDGYFGLAPALGGLREAYAAGQLLFVHACGSTDSSRSHFDAQRFMEVGKPNDPTLSTGWLGRHLLTTAPSDPNALLRAVGISTGLPRTLVGGPLTLPVPDLDNFGLTGSGSTTTARMSALNSMYGGVADPLKAAGLNTVATINLLNTINFAGYVPAGGAAYPTGSLGVAMKSVAALVKAQVGVEAVAIDVGGWDTHANQGVLTGTMAGIMQSLGDSMGAFYKDMSAGSGPSTIVVAMSEFGRRVGENGSLGSDHGHGNVMMVMGPGAVGGRVLTQWPGLGAGQLYQNLDLQVTTDYRDVLAEICSKRLGTTDLAAIFPGYTPSFKGVVS